LKPQQTDEFWLIACKEELAVGRSVGIKAKGLSMFPVIKPKQEVLIKPYSFDQLKIGQIIAFQRKTHIVVHRIVQVDETSHNGVVCQGDANWHQDEPVNLQNYIGLIDLKGKNEQQKFLSTVFYKPAITFLRFGMTLASKIKNILLKLFSQT
jgi:signal peptidase I